MDDLRSALVDLLHSCVYDVCQHSTMVTPSTRNPKPVVRQGPLCIAAVLLFAVPIIVISVLNTRLEKTSHGLDKVDELVESQHWRSQRTILATSAHAKCLKLEKTQDLVLEEMDSVQVVVVDKDKRWWFLYEHCNDERFPCIESVLNLMNGYYQRANEGGPWYVAQNLAIEVLGITPSQALRVDTFDGIETGQVPPSVSQEWIFLGKTPVQQGGGLMYSYLHFVKDVSSSKNLLSLEKNSVYPALLNNRFLDIKAYASIASAMAYFEGKEKEAPP